MCIRYCNKGLPGAKPNISNEIGLWREKEGNLPPHSFRTSFYLFSATRVHIGLPNLPQTFSGNNLSFTNVNCEYKDFKNVIFLFHGFLGIYYCSTCNLYALITQNVKGHEVFVTNSRFLFPTF